MKLIKSSRSGSTHTLCVSCVIFALALTACNGDVSATVVPATANPPTPTTVPTRVPQATKASAPTSTAVPSPTASDTPAATLTPSSTHTPTTTLTPTRRPQSTRTPAPPPTLTYTPTPNCVPPEFFDPFLNRCRLPDQPNPGDVDADGDGYTPNQGDCNDADPTIHPGAPDPPDDVDSDCDGDPFG